MKVRRPVRPPVPRALDQPAEDVRVVLHRARAAELHAVVGKEQASQVVKGEAARQADAPRLGAKVAAVEGDGIDRAVELAILRRVDAALVGGVERLERPRHRLLARAEQAGNRVARVQPHDAQPQLGPRQVVDVRILPDPSDLPVV